jgi:hypothetical protein
MQRHAAMYGRTYACDAVNKADMRTTHCHTGDWLRFASLPRFAFGVAVPGMYTPVHGHCQVRTNVLIICRHAQSSASLSNTFNQYEGKKRQYAVGFGQRTSGLAERDEVLDGIQRHNMHLVLVLQRNTECQRSAAARSTQHACKTRNTHGPSSYQTPSNRANPDTHGIDQASLPIPHLGFEAAVLVRQARAPRIDLDVPPALQRLLAALNIGRGRHVTKHHETSKTKPVE